MALRIHLQRWERFASSTELLLGAPERLVGDLDLSDETAVAVLSAGPDLFASALAERPGKRGTIYSIELSDELAPNAAPQPMPGYVKLRQKENGRLPLADESVDLALWAFAFRTLGHVANMLAETRRILRPGGRIAVVDWIRREENCGPRRDDRVSAATCERCLAASGFGLMSQRTLNESHYLVIGRRPVGENNTSIAALGAFRSQLASFRTRDAS
ncbi:MAG TPA: methyltransferase domain-containing protein [Gemmatimonadaceae bacterium]